MPNDNQDRIDAYLRGEMSDDQRSAFESELRTDHDLNTEYLETKAIVDALKKRAEKLRQMAEWDAQEALKTKLAQRKLRMRRWAIGISAAACVAVAFFAVRPLITYHADYGEFGAPADGGVPVFRGSDGELSSLDALISAKQFAVANAVCDSLLNINALCTMDIQALDTISERDSYRLQQFVLERYALEWRHINILLALGQTQEAKRALEDFVAKDGEYSSEAQTLLDILSD